MENFYCHSAAAALPDDQANNWAANSNFPLTWQQQEAAPCLNASASTSNSNSNYFHELPNSWSNVDPFTPEAAEDRVTAVSKSHSQAEKRRRDRINTQLATLRKLIPESDKMDKAALLGSVIEHVKELKSIAMEVTKTLTVPSEIDEVTVENCELSHAPEAEAGSSNNKSRGNILIKACVSCDDQPEVYKEIVRVVKGLGLTTMRAEMSSVGGRIKSILVLGKKEIIDHQDGIVSLSRSLKQALHLALSRMSPSSSLSSNYRIRSKRQRLLLVSHD